MKPLLPLPVGNWMGDPALASNRAEEGANRAKQDVNNAARAQVAIWQLRLDFCSPSIADLHTAPAGQSIEVHLDSDLLDPVLGFSRDLAFFSPLKLYLIIPIARSLFRF